jgi:hypothetical protein
MNYKITFSLTNGLATNGPLMFDGIIAYAWAQENAPEKTRNIGRTSYDKSEQLDFSAMPIVQHPDGYFMASWAMYDDRSPQSVHTLLKKWDEEHDHMAHFAKGSRAVHIDRGEFKTTQIPIQIIGANEVFFYFQSEDPGRVEGLIRDHIIGLGKKASRGYGTWQSLKIEDAGLDPFQDNIIRPLPEKAKPVMEHGAQYKLIGFRPPYWDAANQAICRVA